MLQNKRRSWKIAFMALVAVLSLSVVLAGCSKKNETGNAPESSNSAANGGGSSADSGKVVATYDGGEITEGEYDLEQRIMLILSPEMEQYMSNNDFREYLLKQEIAYKYLAAKADDKEKEAGAKQADSQLSQFKTQLGDEAFANMLKEQNVSEQEFKDYMVRIFTVVQAETAKVTDDEVKKQFEATKDDYTVASVRHILITFKDAEGQERTKEEALKLAQEVKAKLDADGGKNFAELAKEYSEDPGSKDNGGLYADTQVSTWVDQFKQAALTLPLNTISDPVETSYGYHVMRVESRQAKTFEDLTTEQKDTIKNTIGSQNLDTFMSGDLEKKIIKKIDLPKLAEPAASADAGGTSASEAPAESGAPEAPASSAPSK
ncbi:peptidylprolyl isomerase [Paenibacillus yonginensis]|uniref:Peptidylprolyl isomerase n=1 Tax=Paenibacillus yonginensis TaxID=1462996 RepID=A0A1B1N4K4_9BACL|nr:peptidylprolyl isomerase [Paenibacillus yonginensis]ANS76378.1 peptidylprolyl isomerase [Paenibacillus yonginensis]